MHRSVLLAVLLAALAVPFHSSAQELSLMAGRAEYDLSGVHTSNIWAVRAAGAARSFLLAEASVSYIHTRQQFGRSALVIPEAQVQVQAVWRAFAPYLGAGIGLAIDNPEDDALDTKTDLATSAAVGLRVAVTEAIGLRVDARLHGIEIDYTGTITGVTAGVIIGL
jgi:hypothetical protein